MNRCCSLVIGMSLLMLSARAMAADAIPAESITGEWPKGEWISLFNGKDLTGWTPKITGQECGKDEKKIFSVVDGVLTVSYDGYETWDGQFGHLAYNKPFSKYRLQIEYRLPRQQLAGGPGWATRNSGVMLHGQEPTLMEIGQDFPVSIEAQFLAAINDKPRSTMNVCTPGTHIVYKGKLHKPHCTSSTSKTYQGDQWVSIECEVHGSDKIVHLVEGENVLEYENPQLDDGTLLDSGYFYLQAESGPVEFRKVQIMLLDE